jgi:hypothetical protein
MTDNLSGIVESLLAEFVDREGKAPRKGQSGGSDRHCVEQVQCRCGFDCRRILIPLMAQFDIHRNSGKHKDAIPFVVVVQSAQF